MLVKKRRKGLEKGRRQTQSKASKIYPTMYVTNEKAKHSIENASTLRSIYGNIQDFDWNKTLQEVSQEPVPVSLNSTSKDRHTQTQCRPHLPLQLLVIAHQILQHALAAVKVSGSSEICVL